MNGRHVIRLSNVAAIAALCLAVEAGEPAYGQTVSAKDAGARYGQALGASLACRGVRLSEAAAKLEGAYTGAALDEFKGSAAKIAALWRTALSCEKAREINMCRLMMEQNCAAATAEIGPQGTTYPGLLEFSDEDHRLNRP